MDSCDCFFFFFFFFFFFSLYDFQGNIRPDQAQSTLAIFEGRFNRLKEERDNLAKAKEALELSEPGMLLLCSAYANVLIIVGLLSH